MSKKIQKQNFTSGFTLVELLVTITIFVIITGVVLVNSNKFDSSILLHNLAYDVALTIKQAQSYGVNVRENSSSTFSTAYGVYFNTDTTPGVGGNRLNFVLFNDMAGLNGTSLPDKIYNSDITTCRADSECIQKYSMTKGTYIKSICAGRDENDCNNNINSTKQLSILFIRPYLNALIYTNNQQTSTSTYAKLVLASSGGATSTIVVTSIGQIYVK